MRLSAIILAALFLSMLAAPVRAVEPSQRRLPLQVDGPVTISPWRVAAEPKSSATKDHYIYSAPTPILYDYFGYGWCLPRAFYSTPRVIINNYTFIRSER